MPLKKCKTKPEPHVMDRLIERGVSSDELRDIINKGNVTKTISLAEDVKKKHIEHSLYKIVCICSPCNIRIKTVMLR